MYINKNYQNKEKEENEVGEIREQISQEYQGLLLESIQKARKGEKIDTTIFEVLNDGIRMIDRLDQAKFKEMLMSSPFVNVGRN